MFFGSCLTIGFRMKTHRLRKVFHVLMIACVLMLFRENVPGPREKRIRGNHPFLSDLQLAQFRVYDESAAKALTELEVWLNEVGAQPPSPGSWFAKPSEAKVCVGIMTARRVNAPVLYLRQIMMALLTRLRAVPSNDVYMHIYNVDDKPSKHSEIQTFQDWIPVTNIKAKEPRETRMFGARYTSQIQESLDYSDIMRDLAHKGCKHALLLEDDALPNEHWLEQTLEALRQLENRKNQDWFIVRLYVARWRGWYPKGSPKVTSYDQGFNTVAILMNGAHMVRFADSMDAAAMEYLNGGSFFEAKDIYMGKFKSETGLGVESFEPGVFQHTGIYSSRGARNIRSFAWYMGAKNFASDGKPIVFNSDRWDGTRTERH
jgi:hypothetical protein